MEHMKFESLDITSNNIEKMAVLFPNCITETVDENGKIIETGRFQDVVNDTRRKLLYFKYVNEEFYNEVFDILQEMENYVVDSYNKKIVTAEEKTYFYSELNKKMGKFYKIVYDQYHGIKRRKAKK